MDQVFQTILKRRIDDDNISMFIFDAPTGSGKTYHILKYIRENYQNKKIFFVANLHNQLPDDKALTKDLDSEQQEIILSQTLRLKSIINTFIDNFNRIIDDKDIQPSDFLTQNKEIVEELAITLSMLTDKSLSPTQTKYYRKRFNEQERYFREAVKKYVDNHVKGKKKKKEYVLKQEWIRLLYPVVDIENKSIIFMTVHKFFLPIDPIYDHVYELSNKQFDNALIFFDEFDASKKIILDQIIDENVDNYKAECFRLFRRLYEEILKWNIPKHLHVVEPKDGYKQLNLVDEIQSEVEKIRSSFKKLDEETKHDLYNKFKTRDIDSSHNFIFSDVDVHTITSSNKAKQLVYFVEEVAGKKVNIINQTYQSKQNDNDRKDYERLNYLYQKVNRNISNFIFSYTKIVEKYMQFFNANKTIKDDTMNFSSACNGMIEILDVGGEDERFLIEKIMQGVNNRKARQKFTLNQEEIVSETQKCIVKFDNDRRRTKYDFYKNGFSYMEVVDSFDLHNLESKVYSYNYDMVPEKMIVNLCVNYKIIGVSATSTIPSVLTNYDLTYFQQVLKNRISFCSEEDHKEITKEYNNYIMNAYKHTRIIVDFDIDKIFREKQDEILYLQDTLMEIFHSNDYYIIHQKLEDKDELFRCKDAADLYRSFQRFCIEPEIQSFIHFVNFSMNKHEILSNVCNEVLHSIAELYDIQVDFFFLDSEEFNKCYTTQVIPALEQGKKVFIVTTYHTLGTGVNLKYKLTKNNIGYYDNLLLDDDKVIEKDFDGIYLSKPSNIFPYLSNENNSYHNFMQVIYALEYLNTVGSLSKEDALKYIKKAFRITYMGFKESVIFSQENVTDITYGRLKYLIQAVGRICRTKTKGTKILILSCFDNAKLAWRTSDQQKKINLNKEFLQFSKGACDYYSKPYVDFIKSETDANKAEQCTDFIINSYVRKKWTKESIKKWKSLREFVLRFPTIDTNEDDIVRQYYIECNNNAKEYSYDGYSWKHFGNDMCEYRRSVSMQSARLDRFMQISELKKFFEENQYAIAFEPKKYIMSPSLFQRIYKGALGEITGKFLLEEKQIHINEIEEIEFFERFDFCIGNNICFDFKNWYRGFKKDLYKQLPWIKRKAMKSGYQTIFVINILFEGFNRMEIHEDTDVKIIIIPWLYNVNKQVYNEEAISRIKEEILRC